MADENLAENNAPEGLALYDAEVADARNEGAKQDVIDASKDVHRTYTDGNLPGDPGEPFKYHGYDEIQMFAFYLNGSLDALKKAYEDGCVPDAKLYGLLALERNGQNRTEYVKYMIDTLKLGKDRDDDKPLASVLPGGGPSYTNDTTAITDLK